MKSKMVVLDGRNFQISSEKWRFRSRLKSDAIQWPPGGNSCGRKKKPLDGVEVYGKLSFLTLRPH